MTLENLEETFYRQGFAKFPAQDFAKLGLAPEQIKDLVQIGKTEEQHVVLLQTALAQAGVKPVQPCTYEFGFTDAAGMVKTAAVLENVGVSAYLGAAPLLSDKSILSTAGSILTIESRHQSAIRVFSKQVAVPQAFDTPLSPRAIFSLAAPFIKSCPQDSNLKVQAFPKLAMDPASAANAMTIGAMVKFTSDAASGATHCGFTSGGIVPGGTAFTKFDQANGCAIPEGAAGITYVTLVKDAPLTGVLSDSITVAGPTIMAVS